MKEKKSDNTFIGVLSGILIFLLIIGFNVFMFWICMKIFGWEF